MHFSLQYNQVTRNQTLATYTQPAQSGNFAALFRLAFCMKGANTQRGLHRFSNLKPAAEVAAKPNPRLCRRGEPAWRDRGVTF